MNKSDSDKYHVYSLLYKLIWCVTVCLNGMKTVNTDKVKRKILATLSDSGWPGGTLGDLTFKGRKQNLF